MTHLTIVSLLIIFTLTACNGVDEKAKYSEEEIKDIPPIILPSDFSDAGFYQLLSQNKHAGTIVATEFSDFHRKLNRDYTGLTDSFLNAYDNERMERITRKHGIC